MTNTSFAGEDDITQAELDELGDVFADEDEDDDEREERYEGEFFFS